MGRKKKSADAQPSEFEMQILGVLWEQGPSTVRQVMDLLPDGKPRAYTSVLSVMQVMQKKGLLTTADKKDGLANVYVPAVQRSEVVTPLLRGLVSKVFGGSTRAVVQHLLEDAEIPQDEISQLRQLLDEVESRRKSDH